MKPDLTLCVCGHRKCDHYLEGGRCATQQTDTTTNYKTIKCGCEQFMRWPRRDNDGNEAEEEEALDGRPN